MSGLYDEFTKKHSVQHLTEHSLVNNDLHREVRVVPKGERRTPDMPSPYEIARVVSERAKQIEDGAPIFVELEGESDPIEIAKKEIQQKKCPMCIVRYIAPQIKEIWRVNEMVVPRI